jgi:hypothetical protein
MRRLRRRIVAIYLCLLFSTTMNFAYFVSTYISGVEFWARSGFFLVICSLIFFGGAFMAFRIESKLRDQSEEKAHVLKQIEIIMIIVFGGLISAFQASTEWMLENSELGKYLNLLLIFVAIYVIYSSFEGFSRFWPLFRNNSD